MATDLDEIPWGATTASWPTACGFGINRDLRALREEQALPAEGEACRVEGAGRIERGHERWMALVLASKTPARKGLPVVWPVQEAAWGRFLVLADLDGRSVVLASMRSSAPRSETTS